MPWLLLLGLAAAYAAKRYVDERVVGGEMALPEATTGNAIAGETTVGVHTYVWKASGTRGAVTWRIERKDNPGIWASGQVTSLDEARRAMFQQVVLWGQAPRQTSFGGS